MKKCACRLNSLRRSRVTILNAIALVSLFVPAFWGMTSIGKAYGQSFDVELESKFNSSDREAQIQASLQAPASFHFKETPLAEIAETLGKQLGYPVLIDAFALSDVGLDPSTPVSIDVDNVSLRSGFQLMLQELYLTFHIEHDALVITTPEESEANLEVVVYDISDLVDDRSKELFMSHVNRQDAVDELHLIGVIVNTIAVTDWREVGGPAEIEPFVLGESVSMVISQTQENHARIKELLEVLRQHIANRPLVGAAREANPRAKTTDAQAPADQQPTLQREDQDERATTESPWKSRENERITRFLKFSLPEGVTETEMVDLVKELSPQLNWDRDDSVCIAVGKSLVVRQSVAGVWQVERILKDAGFLVEPLNSRRQSLPSFGTGVFSIPDDRIEVK